MQPSKTLKLSVAIIAYNEEANILACLESVDFASEFIVVDSLSNDSTVEIAEKFGAKVTKQKFLGHVKQKQLAVDLCSNDWVLCIDADERVSEELKTSILELFAKGAEPKSKGYFLSRKSFHLGRWIEHGGWYPDRGIRLFNKHSGAWTGYNPHDRVEVSGTTEILKGDLLHFVFSSLSHNVETNDRYSSIMAGDLFEAGKKPSLLKLILKPPFKFFECYILKAGFLDGLAGFIIAVGAAYSLFLKFAKLWELDLKAKNDQKNKP
ncbi:MAG: glycosyltransferase family 2 protein [SAR324 cluster bacterium]|nr:glycosyltransferase family 2 protein [SAR324 cluster bacterium]